MDHLAACIQCASHSHLLAIELLDLILMVNVIDFVGSILLEYVLVSRLHDRTREVLNVGRRARLSLRVCILLLPILVLSLVRRRGLILLGRLIRLRRLLRLLFLRPLYKCKRKSDA